MDKILHLYPLATHNSDRKERNTEIGRTDISLNKLDFLVFSLISISKKCQLKPLLFIVFLKPNTF